MATMTLKDSEIKAILAEVNASLTAAKKSEVLKLSKAVEGQEDEPASDPAASAPEASDSAPAPEASEGAEAAGGPPAGDVPPPDAASATMDGSAPPDASADPSMGGGDPAADGAQGPVDPQQLAQEYSALDDESLKAHYMACKQAVFARMEQSQGGDPAAAGGDPAAAAGAPPADPSAPPAGGPPPEEGSVPPPAMKAEGKPENGNVVPVTSLEGDGSKRTGANDGPGADLSPKESPASPNSHSSWGEGLKADVGLGKTEREAQLENVVETLAAMVLQTTQKPQRLATTSLQELERRELLSKGEKTVAAKPVDSSNKAAVQSKLSELVREQKLNKSDKEKVMKYYVNGDFKQVAHLFTK